MVVGTAVGDAMQVEYCVALSQHVRSQFSTTKGPPYCILVWDHPPASESAPSLVRTDWYVHCDGVPGQSVPLWVDQVVPGSGCYSLSLEYLLPQPSLEAQGVTT